MKHWKQLSQAEQIAILREQRLKTHLPQSAIEKDWWVTAVLKALSKTSIANQLIFKGGTSLSKGWGVIERFSEDIDLAIRREGDFTISSTSKSQREKVRKAARRFIHETLSEELKNALHGMDIDGFEIECITEIKDRDNIYHAIESDKDPTVMNVRYDSVAEDAIPYMPTYVKIEISCMSMHEPTQVIRIPSMIAQAYPEDDEMVVEFSTVVPTRTFLEKIFLLNEEFAKQKPRTKRMSRHHYDLERLMDTDFGREALKDRQLYNEIVEHRRVFYALKYFDYEKHSPSTVSIIPPEQLLRQWKDDYEEMRQSYIYGHVLTFEELIARMEELVQRIRAKK